MVDGECAGTVGEKHRWRVCRESRSNSEVSGLGPIYHCPLIMGWLKDSGEGSLPWMLFLFVWAISGGCSPKAREGAGLF